MRRFSLTIALSLVIGLTSCGIISCGEEPTAAPTPTFASLSQEAAAKYSGIDARNGIKDIAKACGSDTITDGEILTCGYIQWGLPKSLLIRFTTENSARLTICYDDPASCRPLNKSSISPIVTFNLLRNEEREFPISISTLVGIRTIFFYLVDGEKVKIISIKSVE